ncbi:hypothetical protein AA100600_2666 [Gluconobacter thailandicus F149-1 = NBRC 100600]|nr:hypothetical protein AA100600_2666 [Gluconobacter thailandicus F149-1 = NBRC 100600]
MTWLVTYVPETMGNVTVKIVSISWPEDRALISRRDFQLSPDDNAPFFTFVLEHGLPGVRPRRIGLV